MPTDAPAIEIHNRVRRDRGSDGVSGLSMTLAGATA